MKKIILSVVMLTLTFAMQAQVGVGTTLPDANAQLDVVSTTKGMFIPRLDEGSSEVSTLAGKLGAADDGMLIYNIEEQCIQVWKWDVVEASGVFECLAVVTGGSLGNAGVVKVNIPGALTAAIGDGTNGGGDQTDQSAMVFVGGNQNNNNLGVFQPFGSANFTNSAGKDIVFADLTLSAAPTTNWPENTPAARRNLDQTPLNGEPTSAVWRDENVFESNPAETSDSWLENEIPGQVTIWRINLYGNNGGASLGALECRLRNPESGFTTGYTQLIPPAPGVYSQTFTLTTIADDLSLPTTGGDGYVLEFRAFDAQDVYIESVTRISLYNE
jgi:hypothetical protein